MRRILLAAAMTAAFAVPASHADAQSIKIALRQDADILDPTLSRTYVGRIVYAGLCDKLFDIDAKLNIVPQLATGYDWTDPQTLTVKLRDGLTFHNGEKLDAAAVAYSLNRHLTMQGSFRRSEISLMEGVDVVDPLTLRIRLKQPSAPFLAQLTDRAGMPVAPKAAEAAGKDFGLKPVCAGPFSFVERVPQDRIVLQRFPGYWNAGAIHFDRVTYLPIPDNSIRLANLQAGSIDLSEQIAPNDTLAVKNDPRLRLVTSDALGYQGLTINLANGERGKGPLGRDARVRKAFELSIDRSALIEVVFNGLYTPVAQPLPPSSPFYAESVKPPPRDIAKAKALLKEAGLTPPVAFQLTVENAPDARQVGEVIQSMAAEAGFEVKVVTMEFASSLAAATRGDFEAYQIGWSGRIDVDGNTYPFLRTGQGQNDAKYSNPTVDALLDQGRTVNDRDQRRAIYAKAFQQISQDLPVIYLWSPKNLVGMSAKISGFVPVPDGMIRLQGVKLAN